MPEHAVRAVGTNTLRSARNGEAFRREAEHALGHPIEVIAGREEARLIYLGVAHALADDGERRLVIDIGGGSTECIIGSGFTPHVSRKPVHGLRQHQPEVLSRGTDRQAVHEARGACGPRRARADRASVPRCGLGLRGRLLRHDQGDRRDRARGGLVRERNRPRRAASPPARPGEGAARRRDQAQGAQGRSASRASRRGRGALRRPRCSRHRAPGRVRDGAARGTAVRSHRPHPPRGRPRLDGAAAHRAVSRGRGPGRARCRHRARAASSGGRELGARRRRCRAASGLGGTAPRGGTVRLPQPVPQARRLSAGQRRHVRVFASGPVHAVLAGEGTPEEVPVLCIRTARPRGGAPGRADSACCFVSRWC